MYRTILVPLDGSPLAERVLPLAEALARAAGAQLVLIRVAWAPGPFEGEPAVGQLRAIEDAKLYLDARAAELTGRGVAVDVAVPYGLAAEAILAEARLRSADLIAMSTHGRSGLGRWVYGSVADQVMRRARQPVLIVPAACTLNWPTDHRPHLLVTLDNSILAEAALGPATELARVLDADVTLLEVVQPVNVAFVEPYPYVYPELDPATQRETALAYLQTKAAELRATGLRVTARAEIGNPVAKIAEVAREDEADLIAMATHGSGGVSRFVMGSVATGTIQRATLPVLVIRPAEVVERPEEPEVEVQGARAADVPVTVTLTTRELDLVRVSLERDLGRGDGDESRAGELRKLLGRFTRVV